MTPPRVLLLVLAGGRGGRLSPLTDRRAKPALPIAGSYRLIDVVLSNAVCSGISDVWVVEQYELHSLNDHLANGRPWDLDRTHGGLQVLPPYQLGERDKAEDAGGFAEGNADALFRQRHLVETFAPDVLVVASADHLYRCDFSEVVAAHLAAESVATVISTQIDYDASRYAVLDVTRTGRVRGVDYKPDRPQGNIVATEIFLYQPKTLFAALEELDSDGPLGDYGERLLPKLIAEHNVADYRLEGYWRDVGTIEAYYDTHMQMLGPNPVFRMDDPAWPMLSAVVPRLPAYVSDSAKVRNSLLAPGCQIHGTVQNSVLSPGVHVAASAVVRDSVLLDDVHVGEGAVVAKAIIDSKARIPANATIGGRRRKSVEVVAGPGE